MGKVRITDGDAIWIDAIAGDDELRDRLKAMSPGQALDLEVAGTVARWVRVRLAGSAAAAIRPVETADNSWAVVRNQTGLVEIQPFPTATRLATFEERMYRWDTPQNRIYS